MKLENEFRVEAPVEEAWNTLLDLERVAPCLPGASLGEASGDEHRGTMTVRLGPVTQKYDGTVRFVEVDEENRRAVLRADGKDARGQGTASATITSTMHEENGGTRVRVETEMRITGRAAQFGRGVQQEVASKIIDRFAECLGREIMGENVREEPASPVEEAQPRRRVTDQPEAEPLDLGEASREAILKRAIPVAAGLGLLAVVILLLRRKS
jgi:carbon monoxide dehydrogenase subunit G